MSLSQHIAFIFVFPHSPTLRNLSLILQLLTVHLTKTIQCWVREYTPIISALEKLKQISLCPLNVHIQLYMYIHNTQELYKGSSLGRANHTFKTRLQNTCMVCCMHVHAWCVPVHPFIFENSYGSENRVVDCISKYLLHS